jgi:alpha/beta superfamily hydrolase
MSSSGESILQIPSGEDWLHAVYHRAVHESASGIIFCDPFAEEKKCAHRVLVEAARALTGVDLNCLRFDYRGCGDSSGEFHDFTPADWMKDILAVADYMRSELAIATLGVLGLRLGATMAISATQAAEVFDFAVLWEPIINGDQYMKMNLRRSLIKAMMTDGDNFVANDVRRQHTGTQMLDFDGYQVAQETREQIAGMDLFEVASHFTNPVLLLNITSREEVSDQFSELAEAMTHTRAEAVVEEPFWNRIGLVSSQRVTTATALWLAEMRASILNSTAT